MSQAVDNIALVLEELSEHVRSLERRVAALEAQQEHPLPSETQDPSIALERPRPPATWLGFPPVETPSGVVPILGKAVLGIAGAYLLRAIAESSSVPKLPALFVAIAYACFWMVWAVRIHPASRFASITYGVTSAEGGELFLSRSSSLPALYLPLRRVRVAHTSRRRGT